MRKNKVALSLSPLGLLTLAACGGGGGNAGVASSDGSSGSGITVNGKVQKGPLSDAFVFLDYNANELYDDGTGANAMEPSVRSDANGDFSLIATQENFSIIATTDQTTVDTSSGVVLDGVTLKAPLASSMLTPATTLMEEGNLTASQVVQVLGLPDTIDPLTFDAFADGVDTNQALAVEKASHQIMTVINAFAAAAEGAGASQADSFEVALDSVVQVMKLRVESNLTINLTDTEDLADIKTQVTTGVASVANVNTIAFGAMADDTTTAIMNVNVKINAVTDIGTVVAKNIFSTAQVLNVQVKNGVSAEVTAVGTGTINFIEASEVEAAATNLAPTDITITLPSLAIISNPEISEDADSLLVGTLGAVDEDQAAGVAHTYAIVGSSDTDSASFNINALTGELSFNALPDYETQSTYKVSVTTTDDGDKTYSETITISVLDVDEAAVISGTTTGAMTEDDAGSLDDAGLLVVTGTLTITDPDADDTPVFVAQSNKVAETITGATGLGEFDLTVGGAWTYKVDNAKSAIQALGIGETVTDQFTAVSDDGTTQVVTVTITGINDAAVIAGTIIGDVTEDLNLSDSGELTANGTLTVTDADTGQAVFIEQLSTVGSLGLGVFTLATNGSWTYKADNSQIAVQALGNNVTAVDTFTAVAAGGTEQTVTVTFTGVNDANLISGDLAGSVLEDSGTVLTVSGSLTVTDADAGDSPTFVAQTNTTGSGNLGEFTLMTDGSWSYTADNTLAEVQALSAGVNKTETFSVATVNGAIENVEVTILGALEPVELSLIEATVNSGGFVINGVSANDQSGRSVSNAGDVNGDGYDDLIIGAHRDDPFGNDESGASFVVFGKENGHVELSDVEVNGAHGLGFVINGVGAGDYAGQSVSAAGDVNGDGFDDLLVGAPLTDPNEDWSGSAYLVYGKNDNVPVALSALKLDANLGGFVIEGLAESNFTGQSVSDAGDVNGDGYDDIIISAHKAGPNDPASGTSYVVYGRPDVGGNKIGTAIDLTEIEADTGGFVINGVAENDQSGLSVSGAGDVNGDGFDDLIVGAPYDDPNGDLSGASFVVFGSAIGVAVELTELEGAAGADPLGFVINGVAADDQSGISVSGAGDVNGDGLDDLIVGAMGADPNGSLSGASYVVFGKADGAAVELSAVELNAGAVPTGFIIKGISTDDFSGRSVSGAGDVNGDGLDDLIIGAMGTDGSRDVDGDGDDDLTSGSGSSFVVYGKTGGEAVELSLVASSVGGFVINGVDADDQSGRSVSGAGDVNGDGFADLIVGAPFDDPNGNSYSGASFVVFGGNFTESVTNVGTTAAEIITGTTGDDIIFAGGGTDTITGTAGNDRLSGGNGADTFVFSTDDGTSRILDFSSIDGDKVQVTSFGFANWAALQPGLVASGGGNTKLTLDPNTFIFFDDIKFDEFVASDFIL